jgi:SNF2 family DNA or RNA helicase
MRVFSAYAEKNDGKTIKLQSGVGYVAVKFMIKEVMKAKETFHFNCVVSGRLRRFLDESDLHLNERRSLGTAIKKKDPLILSDYFQFQTAVNKLLDRPLIGDQSLAAYHIVKMKRAANFSVPGAGKTTMVLAAFAYLHSLGLVDKIMMIGPLNSFGSWKREWLATFGSKLKLNAFDYQENKYGTAASRYDAIQRGGAESNLFLINYESLQNNVEALTSVINSRTMLVFDEVHRIKSLTGQRASAALSLCQKAVYRVVLTGTPIPNGYADIYNFLHILFPDEYDDFFTFDVRYLEGAENDPQKQLAINKAINPFFFILTKQDLHVPMPEPDDLTTCRAYVNANEQKLLEMVYEKYRYDPLALCIRLVQAASNPKLLLSDIDYSALEDTDDDTSIQEKAYGKHDKFTGQQASFIKSLPMGQKFYLAIDQIEKLAMSRQQVMVWALFIDTINETESELKNRGIDCRVIYGAVPLDEREKIISDFINGRFDVLIANPNTLAESVSLHKNCHNAVYIEYSYNLVHMLQSRDRIHRVGLLPDQKTRYYYAILDSHEESFQPIDLRIYNRLQEKAKLESDAMSNDYLGYVKIDHDKDIIDMMADAKSASF